MKLKYLQPRVVAKHLLSDDENIRLLNSTPLVGMHLLLLTVPFVGVSWPAVIAMLLTYWMRVFALTGGYHRYFSHRAFKTSRAFQFVLAFLGATGAQLGPLWWAAHHRHHHRHSDTDQDSHSPVRKDFFWSHLGWLLCRKYWKADSGNVRDWMRFPELRWLDRFHVVAPLTLAALMYGIGVIFQTTAPGLGATPWQMVVWGFVVSTVMVYHVTFCVNSVTHIVGNQRYDTGDQSRNNLWVALLTMGEGWHNNHHRYPAAARQGFFRREVDMTYYILLGLQKIGLIWDMKAPPRAVYEEAAAAS